MDLEFVPVWGWLMMFFLIGIAWLVFLIFLPPRCHHHIDDEE